MRELAITSLRSGGVITNLYCSSACKHCLYASSPKWNKDYISPGMAETIINKILDLGCTFIHIGGGEPMLNLSGLKQFLQIASAMKLGIEYIETNSSWYKDEDSAVRVLQDLQGLDVDTLLISISPFHNEYIPFHKVKGLMKACHAGNMGVFPWISDFIQDIEGFSDVSPHSLAEYEASYGDDYLKNVAERFPLNFRGRALLTYKDIYPKRSVDEILAEGKRGCGELANTSHFHIDLFGNYIPGLCSGLSIHVEDLGGPLEFDKYRFLLTLYNQGIAGLLEIAQQEYGFQPEEQYLSKCHLCFAIRRFLVMDKKVRSDDLKPVPYYRWV